MSGDTGIDYLREAPVTGWNPWHGGQAYFEGWPPLIEATVHPTDGTAAKVYLHPAEHELRGLSESQYWRAVQKLEREYRFPGMSLPDAMGVAEQLMAERWLDEHDDEDDGPCPHCGRRG